MAHTMSPLGLDSAGVRQVHPLASVAVLPTGIAPDAAGAASRPDGAAPPRMRLTAKGRGVVVTLAVLGGVVLGFVGGRADAASVPVEPATVTTVVERGDTMWGLASGIAEPGEDVRDVVLEIQRLNGKSSVGLVAGEILLLPAS